VRLHHLVKPLDTAGIGRAEEEAGIDGKGGIEGLLETFAILNDMGYLPLYSLNLSYWIDTPREQAPQPIMLRTAPALAYVS